MTTATREKVIGEPVDRVDGPLKVTGAAPYPSDFTFPGLTHAVLVQSTIAAGTIRGIDAAEALRNTMPHVPILFLSMHQSRQIISEAKRVGVQGYVKKSDAATTLLNAVDALLRNEPFFPEAT